eukprot:1145912-Pelagomonas_calceolata.AAC.6
MQRERQRIFKTKKQSSLYHSKWSLGQEHWTLFLLDLPLTLYMCLAALATSTCSSGAQQKSICAGIQGQFSPSWHRASEDKHPFTRDHAGNSKNAK